MNDTTDIVINIVSHVASTVIDIISGDFSHQTFGILLPKDNHWTPNK